ncbi:hypothetical protein C8J57DRAFT_1457881 [Mycena rebaudengoi]|nr:hypothetical protein C8J57DRAFT_1457881 [Mycena rebaudengoi]
MHLESVVSISQVAEQFFDKPRQTNRDSPPPSPLTQNFRALKYAISRQNSMQTAKRTIQDKTTTRSCPSSSPQTSIFPLATLLGFAPPEGDGDGGDGPCPVADDSTDPPPNQLVLLVALFEKHAMMQVRQLCISLQSSLIVMLMVELTWESERFLEFASNRGLMLAYMHVSATWQPHRAIETRNILISLTEREVTAPFCTRAHHSIAFRGDVGSAAGQMLTSADPARHLYERLSSYERSVTGLGSAGTDKGSPAASVTLLGGKQKSWDHREVQELIISTEGDLDKQGDECTEATVTVTKGSVALPKPRLVTVTHPSVALLETVTR